MHIPGRSMFMTADWDVRTIPRFDNMARKTGSRSSQRPNIFGRGASFWGPRRRSSGFALQTVPPRRSRVFCEPLLRLSRSSSRKTANRAWYSAFAQGTDRYLSRCITGTVSYYRARYYDPQAGRFLSEDRTKFTGGVGFFTDRFY